MTAYLLGAGENGRWKLCSLMINLFLNNYGNGMANGVHVVSAGVIFWEVADCCW